MNYDDVVIGAEYAATINGEKTVIRIDAKAKNICAGVNLRTGRKCVFQDGYRLEQLKNLELKYLVYHGTRTVSKELSLEDATRQVELMLRVGYSNILITLAGTQIDRDDVLSKNGEKMILRIPIKVV